MLLLVWMSSMKRSGNLLSSGIGISILWLLVELLMESICKSKPSTNSRQRDLSAPSKPLVYQISLTVWFHLPIVSNVLHMSCKQHQEPMICLGLLVLFQNVHNTIFIQSLLQTFCFLQFCIHYKCSKSNQDDFCKILMSLLSVKLKNNANHLNHPFNRSSKHRHHEWIHLI